MGRAISEVLPFAVVVAISPMAIVAIIVVLFSARARVNSIVFTLGWVVGVSIVGTVIYLLADAGDVSSGGSGSDTSYWLKLVVGVLLVPLAFRHWRKRPAAGGEGRPPQWVSSLDTPSPHHTRPLP